MTTTVLNTNITEVENKIPDNTKYITTQEFNKLETENFAARLKQADLVNNTDFNNTLTSFNRRITPNKIKQKILNSLITNYYNASQVAFILEVMMDLKKHLFMKQHLIC